MAKKMPSQMNTGELWQWHAEVYAFRRVVLGISRDVQTSPCDEAGQWFNAERVDAAERRLLDQRQSRRLHDEQMVREGRAAANAWAQARGYLDIDEYVFVERIDWSEALRRVCHSILASKSMPGEPDATFDAAALGVKAREFNPSAEQLKAARQELGIDDAV